jgi:predicted TIM-barrel fold metal-dependent hydrolase
VVSKLSALGTFLRANDPAHIGFVVCETLDLFGAERCLFGSNFPIEKLWTDYGALIAAHRAAVPETAQAKVFGETARRVYRLDAKGERDRDGA